LAQSGWPHEIGAEIEEIKMSLDFHRRGMAAAFQVMLKNKMTPEHACDEIRFEYALEDAIKAYCEKNPSVRKRRGRGHVGLTPTKEV
jgi:hypothetical protein